MPTSAAGKGCAPFFSEKLEGSVDVLPTYVQFPKRRCNCLAHTGCSIGRYVAKRHEKIFVDRVAKKRPQSAGASRKVRYS